ncbi:hypothetical protein EV360DRAFT_79331 [Lentinula raphanica]|nr:hypothetical protein EV360DRAFT_79331 [Lentinula raphanica]
MSRLVPLKALLRTLTGSSTLSVPVVGVLARFRAQSNLRGLTLDDKDAPQPQTGLFFSLRGDTPSKVPRPDISVNFLEALAVAGSVLLFMDIPSLSHGNYHAPKTSLHGVFHAINIKLVSLPISIVTYRSITTPYKLPYLNAAKALCALSTPTERRRPWVLYLTPGLSAAEVCVSSSW